MNPWPTARRSLAAASEILRLAARLCEFAPRSRSASSSSMGEHPRDIGSQNLRSQNLRCWNSSATALCAATRRSQRFTVILICVSTFFLEKGQLAAGGSRWALPRFQPVQTSSFRAVHGFRYLFLNSHLERGVEIATHARAAAPGCEEGRPSRLLPHPHLLRRVQPAIERSSPCPP